MKDQDFAAHMKLVNGGYPKLITDRYQTQNAKKVIFFIKPMNR